MRSTPISIPGRNADFWLWAIRPEIKTCDVVEAYLKNLDQKNEQNNALNAQMARTLQRAKKAGVFSPLAAIVCGVIAAALRA
jgi:hypothetical protein